MGQRRCGRAVRCLPSESRGRCRAWRRRSPCRSHATNGPASRPRPAHRPAPARPGWRWMRTPRRLPPPGPPPSRRSHAPRRHGAASRGRRRGPCRNGSRSRPPHAPRASSCTSTCAMNASAESPASAASKRSTTARSSPNASSSSSLRGSGVSRKCGLSGWKNSRGCGSNSITPALPPVLAAASRAACSSAWWPRCTPSKLPMASAAPRAGRRHAAGSVQDDHGVRHTAGRARDVHDGYLSHTCLSGFDGQSACH